MKYLNRADQMVITEIPGEYDGDTRLPEWSQETWKVTEHSPLDQSPRLHYTNAGSECGSSHASPVFVRHP